MAELWRVWWGEEGLLDTHRAEAPHTQQWGLELSQQKLRSLPFRRCQALLSSQRSSPHLRFIPPPPPLPPPPFSHPKRLQRGDEQPYSPTGWTCSYSACLRSLEANQREHPVIRDRRPECSSEQCEPPRCSLSGWTIQTQHSFTGGQGQPARQGPQLILLSLGKYMFSPWIYKILMLNSECLHSLLPPGPWCQWTEGSALPDFLLQNTPLAWLF